MFKFFYNFHQSQIAAGLRIYFMSENLATCTAPHHKIFTGGMQA